MDLKKLCIASSLVVCLGMTTAIADNDIDLRINGDFRGAALNSAMAPGWVLPAGAAKIVRGSDFDEKAIELTADAGRAVSAFSDFIPVQGNTLKIEAELRGSGVGAFGFAAFDAAKNQLPDGNVIQYQAGPAWIKLKRYVQLSNSNIKFVRVVLTAEKNSVVTFGDIEGEFKTMPLRNSIPQTSIIPVAPAPQAKTMPAPAPAPQAKPMPLPASIHQAVNTVTAVPVQAKLLINEKVYNIASAAENIYQAAIPLGEDIEFGLKEDISKNNYWNISSYDNRICRVKIAHDRDGIWPFRYDKAEIELKGVMPGTTQVVFANPAGKTFTVWLTVR